MESTIRYLNGQIDAVPSLDLEPSEKALLKDRLQYKLDDAAVLRNQYMRRCWARLPKMCLPAALT